MTSKKTWWREGMLWSHAKWPSCSASTNARCGGRETFYQNNFHTFLSSKGIYWVIGEANRHQKTWVFNSTWLFIGHTHIHRLPLKSNKLYAPGNSSSLKYIRPSYTWRFPHHFSAWPTPSPPLETQTKWPALWNSGFPDSLKTLTPLLWFLHLCHTC